MNLRLISALFPAFVPFIASGVDVAVRDAAELRQAVAGAKPGTRILLAAGNYGGGFYFAKLRGAKDRPIVIAAADPKAPPVFSDAKVAMHLSAPAFVELHGLTFTNLSVNGLNIDDGGEADGAREVTLRGLRVSKVGSRGNHDGLKLSGLTGFRVEECVIEAWGTGGGSGIDMVGCHQGVIERNLFHHSDPPNSSAVQCKGGSSDIVIRRNKFENAGGRGVNIGGSTGLQFFRPPLKSGEEHAEARGIRVEGNKFVGCLAPVVFAGADGGIVRFNTFENPGRWVLRILQETRQPGFVPCRNGEFTDNLVIFESGRWSEGGVNVGGGTAPKTFKFARNWWYCRDRPERSRPQLPSAETGGVYGQDPAGAKLKVGWDALPK